MDAALINIFAPKCGAYSEAAFFRVNTVFTFLSNNFFLLLELYKSRLHSRLHSYTNFNVFLAGIFGVIVMYANFSAIALRF